MATVKFYNYARAFRSQSEYALRMKYLSNSIFGEVRRPTPWASMRLVTMMKRKPYEERREIVEYYPAHDETMELMTHLRHYGLFRNEHLDFKEEMERIRALKGKSKPKPYKSKARMKSS